MHILRGYGERKIVTGEGGPLFAVTLVAACDRHALAGVPALFCTGLDCVVSPGIFGGGT